MQDQKLNILYQQCLNELSTIGIDMQNKELVGNIDIKISTKATKRYGCCKQENPDKKYKIICQNCGQIIYRKRFNSKLIKKYRCGKCKGKLKLLEIKE